MTTDRGKLTTLFYLLTRGTPGLPGLGWGDVHGLIDECNGDEASVFTSGPATDLARGMVTRLLGPEPAARPASGIDVADIREEIEHLYCLAANAREEGAEGRSAAKIYAATADRLTSALGPEPAAVIDPGWPTSGAMGHLDALPDGGVVRSEPDDPAPDLRTMAARWLAAGRDYWEAFRKEHGSGAVVWVDDTSGALTIFTRGEYAGQLRAAIPTEGGAPGPFLFEPARTPEAVLAHLGWSSLGVGLWGRTAYNESVYVGDDACKVTSDEWITADAMRAFGDLIDGRVVSRAPVDDHGPWVVTYEDTMYVRQRAVGYWNKAEAELFARSVDGATVRVATPTEEAHMRGSQMRSLSLHHLQPEGKP